MAGLLGTVVLASLARGVLAAFPAASKTCSSTDSTSWEIKKFTVDTNSKFFYGNGTVGKASFTIKNTANGYEFACDQGSARGVRELGIITSKGAPNFELGDDGKVWYTCGEFCYGPDTNPPLDTSFSFDMGSKTLRINQKWSCAGGNGTASE